MKYIALIFLSALILGSCKNSSGDEAVQADIHDHGAIAILLFEENMELFAEVDQLVEGHAVDIRAHLTFLENYTPAENGLMYARLVEEDKEPDWQELEMAQAGIFTGAVSPENPGPSDFEFLYKQEDREVLFSMKDLKIFKHDDKLPSSEEHHDEVIFTKEQAWRTEFGLLPLVKKDFSRAIHCSGEVVVSADHLVEVIAPASGKIVYSGIKLIEGSHVNQGAPLFTILGTGLNQSNILVELNTVKADYERSKANFERKEKLLKIQAVSQKDYEEAKAVFENDRARYDVLKGQVNESGMLVKSPVSGFIQEIRATQNSYAETGSVLIKIIKEGGMMIQANVPSSESNSLSSVTSANVRLPSDPEILSIREWGGEVFTYGRSVEPQSGAISMFFRVNNPDLIPGTFLEMWLLTDILNDQLVIPGTSLMEEYGRFFVYVQEEGEAYEKRAVKISANDGINYLVSDGLEAGEVIVSKGAMAIKVANAMGAAPVHSH